MAFELAYQYESHTNDIKYNLVKQKSKLCWDPLQQLLGFLRRDILDGCLALQFQKKMKWIKFCYSSKTFSF